MAFITPDNFVYVVTFVSVIYALAAFVIQRKVGNYARIKEIQKASNDISKELSEASKAKDQPRIDAAMKKQAEVMPMLSEMMMLQMKPLFVIIIVFICIVGFLGMIDPNRDFHAKAPLFDDGLAAHCDKAAGDGIYSACINVTGGRDNAVWMYTVRLESSQKDLFEMITSSIGGSGAFAANTSAFEVGAAVPKWEKNVTSGMPIALSSSKEKYMEGETAAVYANVSQAAGKPIDSATVEIDRGYRFAVDLPFTIPILNLDRLADITGWMIFCSFFISLALNPIMPKLVPSLG
ncbi:MAG: EMC3/TMCO1 family protein [Candidatus Micrarchaeia archaeon]